MKRIISILTVLCLVLCLLAGCSTASDEGLNQVAGGGVNTNGGNANGGDINTGDTNTGDTNTGDANTGNTNTGDANTGNTNTGDANTGNTNTGNTNNSGDSDYQEEQEKDYSDYLTVVTYNLKSLQLDKLGVVENLRKMDGDIVGLQEIDYMNPRTGNVDQMKYLAGELGYSYYYFANCQGTYGHGILSRYPIKVEEHTYTSYVGSEVRKYTRAEVKIDGQTLIFYNTHLTTGTWEQTGTQYNELLKAVYKETLPTVVTGDFNLTLAEQAKRLNTEEVFPLYGGELMVIEDKNISYDNIMVRNVKDYYWNERKDIGVEVIVSEASDHNALYTYIKLK